MLQTLDSIVQSLTMGLKIRNSSQTFLTSFTASSGFFALTMNFNVFALLTDTTLEYPCFNIRSWRMVSPSGSFINSLFSIVAITANVEEPGFFCNLFATIVDHLTFKPTATSGLLKY
jgi:hypothetical protein